MTADATASRFLVLHDYGMGGVWWWVLAKSERQIRETFAEVEVVDPNSVAGIDLWTMDEADIHAPAMPHVPSGLRAERDGQRGQPGFTALADWHVV